MPPAAPVVWSFAACSGTHVQCPLALEAGVARVVGKRYEAGAYQAAEPTTYRLDRRQAATLRAFFAKALRLGHLRPADATTAESFGLTETPC